MTISNRAFLEAFQEQLENPHFGRGVALLADSIARGTQDFDRDHAGALVKDCICGCEIDPDCPLHGPLLQSKRPQHAASQDSFQE